MALICTNNRSNYWCLAEFLPEGKHKNIKTTTVWRVPKVALFPKETLKQTSKVCWSFVRTCVLSSFFPSFSLFQNQNINYTSQAVVLCEYRFTSDAQKAPIKIQVPPLQQKEIQTKCSFEM